MTRRSLLPALALIVAAAGLVDAVAGEVWDLAAVLSVVSVLLVIDLVARVRRPSVSLRPDLVRWMADRAAVEGESIDAVSARAVATYRAHLVGHETAEGGRAQR